MAKKNRSVVDDDETDVDPNIFKVSTTKIGKETKILVTMQLNELHEAHLFRVAKAHGTKRAEFVKQAVAHCLTQLGQPFPKPGEVDDELSEVIKQRRAKREARRIARKDDEEDED